MSASMLKNLYDIFKAIGAVAGGAKNIEGFIDSLSGSSSVLQTLLVDLDQDVVTGFHDVVNAINDEALSKAWFPINQSLKYIGTSLMAYQQALATVAAPAAPGGHYTIVYDSDTINFVDWCDGYTASNGTVHASKLDEMSSWLNLEPLQNSYLSLAGIFYQPNPYGTGAITLIQQMASGAQANPGGVYGSVAYDTQYNTLLKFMEATFKLMALVYYVHDSALSLRNQILGKTISDSGRQSVMGAIAANFGNATTTSSIWNQFANALDALAATTPELKVSAFSPAMFPPAAPFTYHERQAVQNWSFLPNEVQIGDFYSNAFFTGISAVHVQSTQFPEYPFSDGYAYDNAHVALIGSVVQVTAAPENGGSPVYTPMPSVPAKSFYEESPNWISWGEAGGTSGTYTAVYYTGAFVCGTCEPSYAPVEAPSSNNHIRVVTGFKFVVLEQSGAFSVAIALQYGELDMTDPSNPVVHINDSSFVQPSFSGQVDIQQYLVTSPVGDYSMGEMKDGIMTSVRLAGQDVARGPSCLNVQMVPTFYKTDFYQPTNLKAIIGS